MAMSSIRRKWILRIGLCACLATGWFAAWIGWRYMETASRACECEDPVDKPRFALLNPFRDREPERLAFQVIKTIQSGNCRSLPQALQYCQAEQRFRILSWQLTGRSSDRDSSTMRFWVIRTQNGQGSFGDPVWVSAQREGRAWKVTNIDLYY